LLACEIIANIASTIGPIILCLSRLTHPKILENVLGLFGDDFRKRSLSTKSLTN